MATAATGSSTSGSPCGACKFLRRKCATDCIFAPYFCSEQGPARFAAIHKVFGASNVSKLLLHVPVADRCEAVVTIAYEAQARVRDPVYGCVAHIFALQQQVACLQAQLMQLKAQMAQVGYSCNNNIESRNHHHHAENDEWGGGSGSGSGNYMAGEVGNYLYYPNFANMSSSSISPQSSMESSIDHHSSNSNSNDGIHGMQEIQSRSDAEFMAAFHQTTSTTTSNYHSYKKRLNNSNTQTDLGELQQLAVRMMRNS